MGLCLKHQSRGDGRCTLPNVFGITGTIVLYIGGASFCPIGRDGHRH